MIKVLLIALGGGAGAVLRYYLQGWAQTLTTGAFPLGTLVVNVVGCFVIGFAIVALAGPLTLGPELRLLLVVGLLGGFTTYATFGWETFSLLDDGYLGAALTNLLLSNLLGLVGVLSGYRLAQWSFGG